MEDVNYRLRELSFRDGSGELFLFQVVNVKGRKNKNKMNVGGIGFSFVIFFQVLSMLGFGLKLEGEISYIVDLVLLLMLMVVVVFFIVFVVIDFVFLV